MKYLHCSKDWPPAAKPRCDLQLIPHRTIGARQNATSTVRVNLQAATLTARCTEVTLWESDLSSTFNCKLFWLKFNSCSWVSSVPEDEAIWCKLFSEVIISVKWTFKCCFEHPAWYTGRWITMYKWSLNSWLSEDERWKRLIVNIFACRQIYKTVRFFFNDCHIIT